MASSLVSDYDFLVTKLVECKGGKVEKFSGLTNRNSPRTLLRSELASQTKAWLDKKGSTGADVRISLYFVKGRSQNGKLTHKKPEAPAIAGPSTPLSLPSVPSSGTGFIHNPEGQARGLSPGRTIPNVGFAISGDTRIDAVTGNGAIEVCKPGQTPHVHILSITTKKTGVYKIRLNHDRYKWIASNIPGQKWTFKQRSAGVFELLFVDTKGQRYGLQGFELKDGIYHERRNSTVSKVSNTS